jgi:translation initiation factor IF-2
MAPSTTRGGDGQEDPPAPKKNETLNLIDSAPKRRRRKLVEEPPPTPAPAEPAEDKGPTVADRKQAAVSLWEEKERRDLSRKSGKRVPPKVSAKGPADGALPPISLVKEEERSRRQPSGLSARPGLRRPDPTPDPSSIEADANEAETAPDPDGAEAAEDSRIIHLKPPIIVKELASLMGLKPFQLIKDLIAFEVFATPDKSIEPEIASKVCELHGFTFEKEKREKGGGVHKVEVVIEEPPEVAVEDLEEDALKPRAPIITFMGHVDHGKTSLLDFIRKAKVAAGEAGGITQHVAAYSVTHNDQQITFLDTPGHAAFTEMRARGATVTDIVVLVVAADDGVMPQTKEAINHAKAAGVAIIVAINKCDLPTANPMRIHGQLAELGIQTTAMGGTVESVEVSAQTGLGVDELLESMLLQAEIMELKSDPSGPGRATIIESRLEASKGPTATAIVRLGTLKVGVPFICGPFSGKIKSLISDTGLPLKEAGPATPVEILGFRSTPNVGDELVEMESEKAAKRLSDERLADLRTERLATPQHTRLESFLASMKDGEKTTFRCVLKADVAGSVEAIVGQLNQIESEKVNIEVIHSAPGPITDSDILLASASDAVVIGFNTKVESSAVKTARREGIQVKLYSIIYELIDQVKEAMLGLLEPETREKLLGHAEVLQIFKLSNRRRVAGCRVTGGRILRSSHARVLRDKQPVYDGRVETLKRFTDDVEEVKKGLECGIRLGDFHEYEKGDIIECYSLEKIEQTL